MKRAFYAILIAGLAVLSQTTLTSCRGKSAYKALEFAGKYGDDVVKAVNKYNSSTSSDTKTLQPVTYQCATCGGHCTIDHYDVYGNYLYTSDCSVCNGKGEITRYEFK